jgi:heavy-metal-associated domain-containing protein
MIPVAHIQHQLPGRVRLRIPSKRGEVPFFEKVVQQLSKHPAIWELVASPVTGSITLQYSEPLQAIVTAAADLMLFEISRVDSDAKTGESKRLERKDTGAGLAGSLVAGLSGLSLYQVVQGNVVGSAVESFWLSFGARSILGRPDLAAAFAAAGVWQLLKGRLFGSASSMFFYAMVVRQMAAMEHARARNHAAAAAARTAKPGM